MVGKFPNKQGKHFLYEFGLKGQRAAGYWTPDGTLVGLCTLNQVDP